MLSAFTVVTIPACCAVDRLSVGERNAGAVICDNYTDLRR